MEWTNYDVHASWRCDQRFNNQLKMSVAFNDRIQTACCIKYHSCQHVHSAYHIPSGYVLGAYPVLTGLR